MQYTVVRCGNAYQVRQDRAGSTTIAIEGRSVVAYSGGTVVAFSGLRFATVRAAREAIAAHVDALIGSAR